MLLDAIDDYAVQMRILPTLLRLCPDFPDEVQGDYLRLVASLGAYDVSSDEVCRHRIRDFAMMHGVLAP